MISLKDRFNNSLQFLFFLLNQESQIINLCFDIYRFAVCYVIIDPSTGKAHNIVAAINVGPSYHAKIASPVSNDKNNNNIGKIAILAQYLFLIFFLFCFLN